MTDKKRRELVTTSDYYRFDQKRYTNAGQFVVDLGSTSGTLLGRQTQITESEGHSGPYKWNGRDVGGPFNTRKRYVNDERRDPSNVQPQYRLSSSQAHTSTLVNKYDYFGPLYAINPTLSANFPPYGGSSIDALKEWGTMAIAQCKPTKSVADLGTALGEALREGLPSMIGASTWKDRTSRVRGGAGDYLNYQFGIAPLISDMKDAAKAYRNSAEILKQFRRDSGRMVRRDFHFPVEKEISQPEQISITQLQKPYAPASVASTSGFYSGGAPQGSLFRTKTTETRRWFKGAFRYYLPESESLNGLERWVAEADKLYGIKPDVEMLWNLAPWTWAIDWVSNTGDVISNISDAQNYGLTMPYGYMMETSIVTYTYDLVGLNLIGVPPVLSTSLTSVMKQRIAASPYGFGLTWEGLNPKQLSILAALGITRMR